MVFHYKVRLANSMASALAKQGVDRVPSFDCLIVLEERGCNAITLLYLYFFILYSFYSFFFFPF